LCHDHTNHERDDYDHVDVDLYTQYNRNQHSNDHWHHNAELYSIHHPNQHPVYHPIFDTNEHEHFNAVDNPDLDVDDHANNFGYDHGNYLGHSDCNDFSDVFSYHERLHVHDHDAHHI